MEMLTLIYSNSLPQKIQEADWAGLAENTFQPDRRCQALMPDVAREASEFDDASGQATISIGFRWGENHGNSNTELFHREFVTTLTGHYSEREPLKCQAETKFCM